MATMLQDFANIETEQLSAMGIELLTRPILCAVLAGRISQASYDLKMVQAEWHDRLLNVWAIAHS